MHAMQYLKCILDTLLNNKIIATRAVKKEKETPQKSPPQTFKQ